jgi:NAD(P)-dependent dehydrogenase (short-subunit alcohol dehydrogenase family)
LILCDINSDSLTDLTKALESDSSHPKHIYRKCDVSVVEDCNAVISLIPTTTPSGEKSLNYLFNCAGINPTSIPLTEITDTYFTRLMDVNVRGTFNMTRACIPLLSAQSSIVNTASTAGLCGSAGYSVYCATKHAIVGFTKALALELGPKGIRVNAVAPGPIDTPSMAGNVEGGDANERFRAGTALWRLGEAREVAEVVVFLFGEGASFVTGSVVEVTGGME